MIKVFPAARIVARIVVAGDKPRACLEGGVVLRSLTSTAEVSQRTDSGGTIIVDGILPGTYTAEPWCKGYATREEYPRIVVANVDLTGIVWEVETGAMVRGRITDRRGDAIADVRVRAWTWGSRDSYHSVTTHSGPDGRYELRGLRAASYRLQTWRGSRGDSSTDDTIEIVANTVVDKDWVLDDVGSIAGMVVDSHGAGARCKDDASDCRPAGSHARNAANELESISATDCEGETT